MLLPRYHIFCFPKEDSPSFETIKLAPPLPFPWTLSWCPFFHSQNTSKQNTLIFPLSNIQTYMFFCCTGKCPCFCLVRGSLVGCFYQDSGMYLLPLLPDFAPWFSSQFPALWIFVPFSTQSLKCAFSRYIYLFIYWDGKAFMFYKFWKVQKYLQSRVSPFPRYSNYLILFPIDTQHFHLLVYPS